MESWDAPHELVGLPEISGSLVSRVVGWCSEVIRTPWINPLRPLSYCVPFNGVIGNYINTTGDPDALRPGLRAGH